MWDAKYALALTAFAADSCHGRLWVHSDRFPDQAKAGSWALDRWTPDQQVIDGITADYLKHPWMSDGHLDWCLVDARTRREIVGYEETVASIVAEAMDDWGSVPEAVLGMDPLAHRE